MVKKKIFLDVDCHTKQFTEIEYSKGDIILYETKKYIYTSNRAALARIAREADKYYEDVCEFNRDTNNRHNTHNIGKCNDVHSLHEDYGIIHQQVGISIFSQNILLKRRSSE